MKIFYGWRIVAATAGIQFLQAGLLLQAFGAYVAVLSEEMGWSKTALSGGAALQSIEGALLGPLLGWMMDRFGPRAMVQSGVVITGLGFLVLSQISTIGGFYVAIIMIAIGISLSGYFPGSVAIVHWFQRYRARALSLMSLGAAAGGIAVPLVSLSMQTFGWRPTALASGLAIILIGWPLARMVRHKPEAHGETIDGQPAAAGAAAAAVGTAEAPPVREFTAREALRTRAFWLLGLGHGLALLVVTSVNVHAISHIKEGLGYSLAQASLVITLMTVAQTCGVLTGAATGDGWDKRKVAAGCMLAHMVGMLMLTYSVHPVMLGIFAVVHGFAWGLRGPIMQAMRADYFGLRAIGMIMGMSAIIIALGQVAGPMVAGVFADLTGNYRIGFTVLALIAGTGSIVFMMAKKPV
ncbi:MAG: MFS transporter [Burkholderiaceae bacterium]|uniref:MFS transporter n=1 Tax=Hydrogenophaga sp. TaxID=1904254 RepID=UPI0027228A3C|nr:MFS transporter [Hydrogenophaga sp.]MDO8280967.1 MFS transporter [Burkholderiaceae bacterium]MDO9031035.1 MFS transporter [Hydrogenophaga sp.]